MRQFAVRRAIPDGYVPKRCSGIPLSLPFSGSFGTRSAVLGWRPDVKQRGNIFVISTSHDLATCDSPSRPSR